MRNEILSRLPVDFPWQPHLHWLDSVDSTNSRVKAMAAAGAPHGTVLIAGQQTGGRGRLGRSFHSPPGSGLYLSVLLRPQCPPAALMHLTCAAAVAACNAVEETAGFRPGIKWTNDLVSGGKKLAGILTELGVDAAGRVDWAVVGIGINCTQEAADFPPELREMAGSLSMLAGRPVAPAAVAAAVIAALRRMDAELHTRKAAVLDQYRRDCITLGREVLVVRGDESRRGKALDIDENGGLLVEFSRGNRQTVTSGEVSVRGLYGYL